MYLSYEQYQDIGGTLDETTFNQLEFEAASFVDWITFSRLKKNMPDPAPESLPMCMYTLIDFIYAKNKAIESGAGDETTQAVGSISHQDNDGVSVSYNVLSARQSIILAQQEMGKVVKRYLQGVRDSLGHKVLYRGLYPDE